MQRLLKQYKEGERNFKGARLEGAQLQGADLPGIKLNGSTLRFDSALRLPP